MFGIVIERLSPIFKGGLNTNDSLTKCLILAANRALDSLEDDIKVAKGYLNQIVIKGDK